MKKFIKKLTYPLQIMQMRISMKRFPDVWGDYMTHCNDFNPNENIWLIIKRLKKKHGYKGN